MYCVTYRFFALLVLILGIHSPTFAEDDPTTISLGGAVLTRPAYVGSDKYQTNILPYLGFENLYGFDLRGLSLTNTIIELGTGKGPRKWSFEAGPRVSFDFGRNSTDSPTLDGLEDIDPSLLVGGFARTSIGVIGFDISAGQDVIDGHGGFLADFSVGTYYPGDGWYIQPIATLSWSDRDYTQSIYGITAKQSEQSTINAFNVNSGFHQASATLLGGFDLDENWSVNGVISYREALGDYQNSPIITAEDGSPWGIFATIGISRKLTL